MGNLMESIDAKEANRYFDTYKDADVNHILDGGHFGAWNSQRDASIYETADIQSPELRAYVNSMREAVAREDFEKHVVKKVTAGLYGGKSTGYWKDSQDLPIVQQQATEYRKQADEILKEIDVSKLSASDYLKLANVQCNANNVAENVQEMAVNSSAIRATVANLDDNQMSAVINRLPKKVQQNFMENVQALYPECMPDKALVEKNAEEAIRKFLEKDPRPDFTHPTDIKDCFAGISNDVHKENVAKEKAEMGKNAPVAKHDTRRYDVQDLAYGTLNKDGTGLDFN